MFQSPSLLTKENWHNSNFNGCSNQGCGLKNHRRAFPSKTVGRTLTPGFANSLPSPQSDQNRAWPPSVEELSQQNNWPNPNSRGLPTVPYQNRAWSQHSSIDPDCHLFFNHIYTPPQHQNQAWPQLKINLTLTVTWSSPTVV